MLGLRLLTAYGKEDLVAAIRFTKKNLNDFDRIFFPVHVNGNHWCLFTVNLKLKEAVYLDSLGAQSENAEQCLTSFKNLCRSWNYLTEFDKVSCRDFKLVQWQHAKQKDNSSCGIFVVNYMYMMSLGGSLTDDVNTSDVRLFWQVHLLQMSGNMKCKCLYCGLRVNGCQSTKCRLCERLIHEKCCRYFSSVTDIKKSFTCKVCNLALMSD